MSNLPNKALQPTQLPSLRYGKRLAEFERWAMQINFQKEASMNIVRRLVAFCIFLSLFCNPAYTVAGQLQKGPILLAEVNAEVWGSYKIRQMLFPSEEWEFFVIVVPTDVKQGTLIKIAKEFYAKYPNTRARFFSDKKYIQQYVDRDRYVNDKSGTVKEAKFPDEEWVQNNLLGNINNRSEQYQRHWMLEDRYGHNIMLLP